MKEMTVDMYTMTSLKIGEGAGGKIYKGTGPNNTPIAIKLFDITTSAKRERYLQEVQTTKAMSSLQRYSVSFIDSFEKMKSGFMVLEQLSCDLLYVIENQKRIESKQACNFFKQMCFAVNDCHNMGFAHLDLKPENFLLSSTGEIRLCDYGNAIKADVPFSGLRGTCMYSAPEVKKGLSYNPIAADIWSLGICLFVMLTGYFPLREHFDPYGIPTAADLSLEPLKVVQQDYDNCCNLISRMLDFNPSTRITMAEILDHPWLKHACPVPSLNRRLLNMFKKIKHSVHHRLA